MIAVLASGGDLPFLRSSETMVELGVSVIFLLEEVEISPFLGAFQG